jgi:hypothetical protein
MTDQSSLLKMFAGEWTGAGNGGFPGIEPFEYIEILTFALDESRPLILHYLQKTSRRRPGQTDYVPSHWESGFLRLLSDTEVEIANAQSGGRVEVLTGTLELTLTGVILRLESKAFANDPRMQAATRLITLNANQLHYTVRMRTSAVPETALHLEATLTRR